MGGIEARRIDGGVQIRCRTCQRIVQFAVASFGTLTDSINAFLRQHLHEGSEA